MKKTEEEIREAATANCNPYELMGLRNLEGDYISGDEVCKLIWDAWRHGAKWMQEQDNWINVEDRLPENRTYVLVHYYNGYDICQYKHGCFFIGLERINQITHWQTLPEPPKH